MKKQGVRFGTEDDPQPATTQKATLRA